MPMEIAAVNVTITTIAIIGEMGTRRLRIHTSV